MLVEALSQKVGVVDVGPGEVAGEVFHVDVFVRLWGREVFHDSVSRHYLELVRVAYIAGIRHHCAGSTKKNGRDSVHVVLFGRQRKRQGSTVGNEAKTKTRFELLHKYLETEKK